MKIKLERQRYIIEPTEAGEWMILMPDGSVRAAMTMLDAAAIVRRDIARIGRRRDAAIVISSIEWRHVDPSAVPPITA